jgi:hypothetical protein
MRLEGPTMRASKISSLLISAIAGGCAAPAQFPTEYSVSVSDVVDNVRCELWRAQRDLPFLVEGPGWSAAIQLALEVDAKGDGGLSLSLAPAFKPGTFAIGAGAKYLGESDRTAENTFSENFKKKITCVGGDDGRTKGVRLGGKLGLYDWLSNTQNTVVESNINLSSISYSIKFIVDKTGSINPAFKMVPIGTSHVDGGPAFDVERKDTDTLTITLSKNKEVSVKKKNGKVVKMSVPDTPSLLNQLNNFTLKNAIQNQ